jgi:hypothetical protein
MIKRDEIAGPSCLTHAADDEPLFVLRANDEMAPHAIREWVNFYVRAKGGYGRMSIVQKSKADEAYAVARQMEQWRALHRATK